MVDHACEVLRIRILLWPLGKVTHQGPSLLVGPFGGPLPDPCPVWCRFCLTYDQTCTRLSRVTAPGQRDEELVPGGGGHRRRSKYIGRRGRRRRHSGTWGCGGGVVGKTAATTIVVARGRTPHAGKAFPRW